MVFCFGLGVNIPLQMLPWHAVDKRLATSRGNRSVIFPNDRKETETNFTKHSHEVATQIEAQTVANVNADEPCTHCACTYS